MQHEIETLSDAITPAAVAAKLRGAGIHISERTLRERARALGACRIIGKTMFLMPSDIDAILEAAKPAPRKPQVQSGSTWTDKNTEALLERIQSAKKRKSTRKARS